MDGNSAVALSTTLWFECLLLSNLFNYFRIWLLTDKFSAMGTLKPFHNREVQVTEMQSSGASRCSSRFACSRCFNHNTQLHRGLLLMIPNSTRWQASFYRASIHVSYVLLQKPRSFNFRWPFEYLCLPSDRLIQCSVQTTHRNVWTFAAVAHLSAIKDGSFLHYLWFRTSHEIQKGEESGIMRISQICSIGTYPVEAFTREKRITWAPTCNRGTAQNSDIFFQAREACNKYYDAVPPEVVECMNKVNSRHKLHKPFSLLWHRGRQSIIVIWVLYVIVKSCWLP